MPISFKMRFLVKKVSRIIITQNLFNLSNHSTVEWAGITSFCYYNGGYSFSVTGSCNKNQITWSRCHVHFL